MPRLSRTTLLLQGPVGPFFRGLARELERRGDRVLRVVFNGGDELFAEPRHSIPFRGDHAQWPTFLAAVLRDHAVDRVVLFGDCRPLHATALQVCRSIGVGAWVVEEGYLRPWFLTFEAVGVNARSRLSRDPADYHGVEGISDRTPFSVPNRLPARARPYRWVFTKRVVACMAYYLALALLRCRYAGYRHHRCDSLVTEAAMWVRAGLRKLVYHFQERHALARLQDTPYFLIPLQVEGDSQVEVHSRYSSVRHFITEAVRSFARHAPRDCTLVLKHHPMDRGYRDYTGLVAMLRTAHGLGSRLVYVHDLPLPALLHAARGVVGINSTALLSALQHGRPVKCLGTALFDLPGLTNQGPLDAFWNAPGAVDLELLRAYLSHLVVHTQLNASSSSRQSTWDLLDRLPDFAPTLPTRHLHLLPQVLGSEVPVATPSMVG